MTIVFRTFIAVALVLILSGCGSERGTGNSQPPMETPKAMIGYWSSTTAKFTLTDNLIRVHSDGTIERLLPDGLDNTPNILGRFTRINSNDGTTIELKLQVAPGVAVADVVSLPFQFKPLPDGSAEFGFITNFYKIEVTKPVGPFPGGFWGPGDCISFPVHTANAKNRLHGFTLAMKPVDANAVARSRGEYLAAQAARKANEAAWKMAQIREVERLESYYKMLAGGPWVLEKIELRDRKTGQLHVEEKRSTLWTRGKTTALSHSDIDKVASFRVTPNTSKGPNEWIWTYADGSTSDFTSSPGRRLPVHQNFTFTPVDQTNDTIIFLTSNPLVDFKNLSTFFFYRRIDPITPMPAPQNFSYDASKILKAGEPFEKTFSDKVKGVWYLQRFDWITNQNSGAIYGSGLFDSTTDGSAILPKEGLPYLLDFTSNAKVSTNGKPAVGFGVGKSDGFLFMRTDDGKQSLSDGLHLIARTADTLQMGSIYKDRTMLLLTYGTKRAPETDKMAIARAKNYDDAYRSDSPFDREATRVTLQKKLAEVMRRWETKPAMNIQLPVWVAPAFGLPSGETKWETMNAHVDDLPFLNTSQLMEVLWLIERTLDY